MNQIVYLVFEQILLDGIYSYHVLLATFDKEKASHKLADLIKNCSEGRYNMTSVLMDTEQYSYIGSNSNEDCSEDFEK